MMKRILITGAGSYIGTSVDAWLQRPEFANLYQVDTIDMHTDSWKSSDFSGYHTVFHVAGIAHQRKHTDENLYDRVNHLLPVDVFQKCVDDGTTQFIFMSSAHVFGQNDRHNKSIIIRKDTKPNPGTIYGRTKLSAELDMLAIQEQAANTVLAIIRPPMIYGPRSKGNYPRLSNVIRKLPVFPEIHNQRSMIYIDNFCECIRLIIENKDQGIFYPQNKDYVDVSRLALEIARVHGKNLALTKRFNPLLKLAGYIFNPVNKIFGNYIYEKELSAHYNWEYCLLDEEASVYSTESR